MELHDYVNKVALNTFSKGMDYDSPNNLISKDHYRYAENIRISDGIAIPMKGSDRRGTIAGYSEDVYLNTIGSIEARAYITSIGKTIEGAVIFHLYQLGENQVYFYISFIPSDEQYGSIIPLYSEEATEAHKTTTVDCVKIGQDGYDTIYFVDNVRPPRKLDLKISSVTLDGVRIQFVSLVQETLGYTVNVRVFSDSPTVNAFRVYVRSYRTSLGPSHPSSRPEYDSERLKFVDFSVGATTRNLAFRVYPEDLDNWTFQIFYTKVNGISYSDFIIKDPDRVSVAVGVLSEANKLPVRADASGNGAQTQLDSWDFIANGTTFNFYTETISGVTRVYKSNRNVTSNLASPGFYQLWTNSTVNTYVEIGTGGVFVDAEINNANVVFDVSPDEYQDEVEAHPNNGDGNYNRLATVNISVPSIISSETLKRINVGNSLTFTNNTISYTLTTKDQVVVNPVYRDDITLRLDNTYAEEVTNASRTYKKFTYEYSLIQPVDAAVTVQGSIYTSAVTQNTGPTDTPDTSSSSATIQVGTSITNTSSSSASDEFVSDSDAFSLTIPFGSKMIVTLLIDIRYAGGIAQAEAGISFTGLTVGVAATPTKISQNGTLIEYSIGALNKEVN
jgi:hypothetical protein